MGSWGVFQYSVIEYFYTKKEVVIIYASNYDFFFCVKIHKLIFSSGCRSPPKFNFKNLKLNGGKEWVRNTSLREIL